MLEQREVNEAVDGLDHSLTLCGLHHWFGFGSDWPHEGPGNAAVEEQAAEDQEASSPAELVEEPGVQRSQGGEEHRTAGHGNAISNRPPLVEVFSNHGEGWVEVESQTQA